MTEERESREFLRGWQTHCAVGRNYFEEAAGTETASGGLGDKALEREVLMSPSSWSREKSKSSGATISAAILIAFGLVLSLPNSSYARSSYCAQVRQAVATYGYAAARRHAMAHYGRKAVRAGDRCLAGGHHRRA